jgi:hypothetical protein
MRSQDPGLYIGPFAARTKIGPEAQEENYYCTSSFRMGQSTCHRGLIENDASHNLDFMALRRAVEDEVILVGIGNPRKEIIYECGITICRHVI